MQAPISRITVGITCYNAADTIERAVTSALSQEWPNLEIVVVDDASEDASKDILRGLADRDRRVTLVIHERNRGPAAARNSILEKATGEFIAFFDDDDESFPHRLAVQYRTLLDYEAKTGVALLACYASGRRRYPNGYEMDIRAIGSMPTVPIGEELADYILFFGRKGGVFYGAGTPTCSLMARKTTFAAVGGFDPDFRRMEDADFAVRMALAGGHFIGCPEPLYRQHATVSSDKSAQKNYEAEIRLIEKHKDYLRHKGRYRYARDWIEVRFHHFNRQPFRLAASLLMFLARHPLAGFRHLLTTGPRRFRHERRINRQTGDST